MHISRAVIVSILLAGTSAFGAMAQTTQTTQATSPTAAPSQQQQDFASMLAKAELTKQGITPKNTSKTDYQIAFNTAIKDIEAQRSAGLGWGAIANQMGLNWGKLVSQDKHDRNLARESKTDEDLTHAQNKGGESHASGHGTGGQGGGKK